MNKLTNLGLPISLYPVPSILNSYSHPYMHTHARACINYFLFLLYQISLAVWSNDKVINGRWWKAKIPRMKYEHAIAAYDATIVGLPSQCQLQMLTCVINRRQWLQQSNYKSGPFVIRNRLIMSQCQKNSWPRRMYVLYSEYLGLSKNRWHW